MKTFYDYMLDPEALTLDRIYSREEMHRSILQRSFLDDAFDRLQMNAYTECAYKECADPRMLALLLEKTSVASAWPIIQPHVESWLWPAVIQQQIQEHKGDMLRPYVNIIVTLQRTSVPLSDWCVLPSLWSPLTKRALNDAPEKLAEWIDSVALHEELSIYPSI